MARNSFLVCLCIIGAAIVQGALEEVEFNKLVPAAPDQIVLMFTSGSPESDQAYTMFQEVESLVVASGLPGTEKLAWRTCDTHKANNKAEMEFKGLSIFPMVFVSIGGQGMDRYIRELSAAKLSEFIITKFENTTDEDVFPYNEELITDAYPVFVKFHELWCSRCLAMKRAFENAATRMVGRVMFMEVECSSSDLANRFCLRHHVDGYPTLRLMGGNLSQPIEFQKDRSVQGFLEFLNEHVPEVVIDESLIEDPAAEPAPAQPNPEL